MLVKYEGWFENGAVFEFSNKHSITIGEGSVIEGWDKGIMEMKLGEKFLLKTQNKNFQELEVP